MASLAQSFCTSRVLSRVSRDAKINVPVSLCQEQRQAAVDHLEHISQYGRSCSTVVLLSQGYVRYRHGRRSFQVTHVACKLRSAVYSRFVEESRELRRPGAGKRPANASKENVETNPVGNFVYYCRYRYSTAAGLSRGSRGVSIF